MQEQTDLAPEHNDQTATTPMQAMSFTDILDGMFTLYRNHFRLFLGIVAIYFVLGYAIDKITFLLIMNNLSSGNIMILTYPLLAATLLTLLVVGALSYASAQVFLGKQITYGAALQQALRRYLPFLGCYVVYFFVTFGLSITIIGFPFAIYLIVQWGLYSLPVLFEETTAMKSLRRSSDLVKGTWWRVFGIMLAIFVIYQMIQFILTNSFGLIFSSIIEVDEPQAVGFLESIRRLILPTPQDIGWNAYMIRSFVVLAITAVTMPIATIGTTLLYFDLRIRKEAYDIEMQATN